MLSHISSVLRRWQLLGAFACVIVLAGAAAGFGLHDLDVAIAGRIDLEETSAAADEADVINTLFISRNSLLENAFLFSNNASQLDRAEVEIAGLDGQVLSRLDLLRSDPAVQEADRVAIEDLQAPLWAYRARSDTALRLVRSGSDPYLAQQRAVAITHLQSRPVSEALSGLAERMKQRAADQLIEVDATGSRALMVAAAAMLCALLVGLFVGTIGIRRELSGRKRVESALRNNALRSEDESRRLLALHNASTILAAQTADVDAVLDEVLKNAALLIGATSATAYRWVAEEGVLRSARDWQTALAHGAPDLRPGMGIAGQTFSRGEPVIVNDYRTWDKALQIGRGMAAGMGVPLIRNGNCMGVLVLRVYGQDPARFTEDDARIVLLFADQAAVALSAAEGLAQQRWAAQHDALTGLANRVLFTECAARAIEDASQQSRSAAVLVMNIDRFKEINDAFGYQTGDLLLNEIGPRIQACLTEDDTLARLGGDEFALLLPGADAAGAQQVAERLQRAFEQPFELQGAGVEVSGSIGIAVFPDHAVDADTLMQHADAAMYLAKQSRSGWTTYVVDADHNSADRLALVADLRRAIERDELVLHFQPQVDVRSGALVAVEALVRWPHPVRGLLAPNTFIPLAEQTRLIRPLTLWALGAALRQSLAWQADGLVVPISVNLSAQDLQDPTFPAHVATLLEDYQVSPELLQLEITEGSLLVDPRSAHASLAAMRSLGVRISIDDFGTGYSSLSYLQRLPLDELKIDRSFVTGMAAEESARSIVRAVIDLADDLGLRVVAEGVEDAATWEVLAALGCNLAQGYYFSPPLSGADLQTWASGAATLGLKDVEHRGIEAALTDRGRDRGTRLAAEREFIARKRAEKALQESEERLRLAIEAADVATWDWELTRGQITLAGSGADTATVDASPGEFLASVHPDDRELVERAVAEAIRGSGELNLEHRKVQAGGEVRWVARKGRVLRDMAGRPTRLLGTDVDITERKAADRQREQLGRVDKLRALGQMASGIAHDLNQSLLLIAGNGDLARQALDEPGTDVQFVQEALETITQAAIQGGDTVKRLLTFARNEPEAEAEPVPLQDLLNDVAMLTAPRWRDAAQILGHPITMLVAADPEAIAFGWTAGLREALTHLIFNAVDALPEGGTIRLSARRADEADVIIEVTDSGVGMEAEVQARSFEPFFTTKGARGTGLGLAQVFGIVERHRGRIEVDSAPGQGTTVRLYVPALRASDAPDTARPLAASPRPLRILAVDDEPLIGKMMARMLRSERHVVVTAHSGEEAVERLRHEAFDLIISDVGMGRGMNGWELAELVRHEWPNLRVVLATGWGAQIGAEEARLKGVDAVLAKPYRRDELIRVLDACKPAPTAQAA